MRILFAGILGVAAVALIVVTIRPIFGVKMPGGGAASISEIGKSVTPGLFPGDEVPQKKTPVRKWEVLDPATSAEAALIYSLDDDIPFFSYNTYKSWPMASITKLLTAIVVIEEAGLNQKIPISEAAVATEGEAGGLRSGEVYSVRDLLQIMLLTSSNDAAAAFEEYFGGRDAFAAKLNAKATEIGMIGTVLYDGSGLADHNSSSASDILKLMRYIAEKKPEIFGWTRLRSVLLQPINDVSSKQIANINPFVMDPDFLGGKTGTSPLARENFAAVFSFENRRIAIIMLGSTNRAEEIRTLFDWVKNAYELQ